MHLTVGCLPVQAAYEHLTIEKLATYVPVGNCKLLLACVREVDPVGLRMDPAK